MNNNHMFIELTGAKGKLVINFSSIVIISKNFEGKAEIEFTDGDKAVYNESYEEVISCLPLIRTSEIG